MLKAENISYKVKAKLKGSEKQTILNNISFILKEGEIIGITGESGSGKTTLAKILGNVLKDYEGKISLEAGSQKTRSNPVQILFQNNGNILNPFRQVKDVVIEALLINFPKSLIESRLISLLNQLEIPSELLNRRCYQLSGGEQQRIALARILAVNPKILILDEPFSAQDEQSQLNLLKVCKNLSEDNKVTIICISHNLLILRDLAERILIMHKGEIVEEGSTNKIFTEPSHQYSKFLLKAEQFNLREADFKLFKNLNQI